MADPPQRIEELARSYTEAWCSRDPARVASHYVPGGTIAINGGEAAGIEEVAQSFIAAFPDIEVFNGPPRPPGRQRRRVPLDLHRHERRDGPERAHPWLRGVDDRRRWPDRRVARPLRPGEYERQLQREPAAEQNLVRLPISSVCGGVSQDSSGCSIESFPGRCLRRPRRSLRSTRDSSSTVTRTCSSTPAGRSCRRTGTRRSPRRPSRPALYSSRCSARSAAGTRRSRSSSRPGPPFSSSRPPVLPG